MGSVGSSHDLNNAACPDTSGVQVGDIGTSTRECVVAVSGNLAAHLGLDSINTGQSDCMSQSTWLLYGDVRTLELSHSRLDSPCSSSWSSRDRRLTQFWHKHLVYLENCRICPHVPGALDNTGALGSHPHIDAQPIRHDCHVHLCL